MNYTTNARVLPTNTDKNLKCSFEKRRVLLFNQFYESRKAFLNKLSVKFSNANCYEAKDYKQELSLALWECTNKYLNEKNKKGERYYKIFPNFNCFATKYIKYKLQYINYQNNLNKLSGKINDTRFNREIYFKNNDTNNIFKEDALSIDEPIDKANKENTFVNLISSRSCDGSEDPSIDDLVSKKQIQNIINNLTLNYINSLDCKIKKEILISRKLSDLFCCYSKNKNSLKILSNKFKISLERVRQISETEFEKYYSFLKKNLNLKLR